MTPWDVHQPQPAVRALVEVGGFAGRVLDVGSGRGGTVALLADRFGVEATGVDLSPEEMDQLDHRVRGLEAREHANLSFLREEMGRVRAALGNLYQVARRSQQVRRGYAGATALDATPVDSVLGSA